jgi:hypothetical protein
MVNVTVAVEKDTFEHYIYTSVIGPTIMDVFPEAFEEDFYILGKIYDVTLVF